MIKMRGHSVNPEAAFIFLAQLAGTPYWNSFAVGSIVRKLELGFHYLNAVVGHVSSLDFLKIHVDLRHVYISVGRFISHLRVHPHLFAR